MPIKERKSLDAKLSEHPSEMKQDQAEALDQSTDKKAPKAQLFKNVAPKQGWIQAPANAQKRTKSERPKTEKITNQKPKEKQAKKLGFFQPPGR